MKLNCKTVQDLFKLYHVEFFGQQGFLLPGRHLFSPGKTVVLAISIGQQYIGSAQTAMIWQNLEVKGSETLPWGTFFKVLQVDTELERMLTP